MISECNGSQCSQSLVMHRDAHASAECRICQSKRILWATSITKPRASAARPSMALRVLGYHLMRATNITGIDSLVIATDVRRRSPRTVYPFISGRGM